ncbi:hypothetical protein NLJ89_g932 [Agrocybe chaxingu]|uniref:Uncharacterized protein n=1 Tax=Agrocybe chaxingu TaxID=84603 RepID=A0A9W8TFY7_9AGAR|nr:hypothetical protein NLJ89_g932 [Agrocybe chaxingu]
MSSSNESTPSPTISSDPLSENVPMLVPQTVPAESAQNVKEEAIKSSTNTPEALSGKDDEFISKMKEDVSDDEDESDDEPPAWKGGMARGRVIRPTRDNVGAKPKPTVNATGTNKPATGTNKPVTGTNRPKPGGSI